jgi:hypothetical protein
MKGNSSVNLASQGHRTGVFIGPERRTSQDKDSYVLGYPDYP